jgi:drug/metabolite transporter (DMT)-like permease
MWGASFLWLNMSIPDYGWAATVSFRSFIAAGALVVIAFFMRRRLNFQNEWKNLAVLGLFAVGFNLGGMNFALTRLDTSIVAILTATIPLYSLIIEWVWHRKRPAPSMIAGLIIGFAGVVMLIGFTPQKLDAHFLIGFLGSTIASSGFAMGGTWAKAKLPHMGNYEQTIGTFLFGGLWTLPIIAVVPMEVVPPSLKATLALITVAVTASSFAYILYYKLVDTIGATKALTTEFFVPVWAIIIGFVVLHERITLTQLIAAAVILAGCMLVMGFGQKNHEPLHEDVVAH